MEILFRVWHMQRGNSVSFELVAEDVRHARQLFAVPYTRLGLNVPDVLWIEELVNGKWRVVWSKL